MFFLSLCEWREFGTIFELSEIRELQRLKASLVSEISLAISRNLDNGRADNFSREEGVGDFTHSFLYQDLSCNAD